MLSWLLKDKKKLRRMLNKKLTWPNIKVRSLSMRSRNSKIAALLVSHWANDGYSVILPPLLLIISLQFGLSTMQAATIISVYTMSSALVQLPLAFLADYSGRSKQILALGMFVSSAALFGYGGSTSYAWLLFFAFWGGLGFSGYHPISMNLMTQLFNGQKGFSLGIHTVAGSLGATMVPIILGVFSASWQVGVWLLAVPGIISGLWILLAFNGVRGAWKKDKSILVLSRKAVANPRVLLTTLFGGLNQMVYWGSLTFIPLFFAHRFHWSIAATNTLLGVFHFSALVSQPLFGYLSDILERNRLLFILGAVIASFTILFSVMNNAIWCAVFSVVIGAAVLALRPLTNAKVADITSPQVRSTAIGLSFTFSSGLGAAAPLLGGYMEKVYSFQAAFFVFGLIALLGLSILLILNGLEKRSAGKAEAAALE